MNDRYIIFAVVVVQAACAFFFVFDILASIVGLRLQPLAWRTREFIEIGAAVGLILGTGLGAFALARSLRQQRAAEDKLRRASTVFGEVLEDRFREWSLTPAERDVALFLIKGMSISEVALLRETSEGTVKAQTNAIYRKAGVAGNIQLLGLFMEDLIDNTLLEKLKS